MSEIPFSVFSPSQPSLAVTNDTSSLPFSRQSSAASRPNKPELSLPSLVDRCHHEPPSTSEQGDRISRTTTSKSGRAEKQTMEEQRDDALTKSDHGIMIERDKEGELVQSLNTNCLQSDSKQTKTDHAIDTSSKTSDTTMVKMATYSQKRPETKSDENVSLFNTNTQSHTPNVTHLTKDQQLREEERFLLAKIHQMTHDRSPASDHHSMKLLIPDPRDTYCDTAGFFDHSEPRIFHSLDTIEEISLSEEDELDDELPQNHREEKDV